MPDLFLIRNIRVPLHDHKVLDDPAALRLLAARRLKVDDTCVLDARVAKESLDARKRNAICFQIQLEVQISTRTIEVDPEIQALAASTFEIPKPPGLDTPHRASRPRIIIVGAGPAGLFAALGLAEAGFPTLLLERGKPVETRMKDIGQLRSKGLLDPESNVCFGEGGAGTYTDGKLYTRIKHPFLRWAMAQFVRFGAPAEILSQAHPHLGTDRLMRIIQRLRKHLIDLGVDIRFETRVDRILTRDQRIVGVRCAGGEEIPANHVVLGIGHSARDTFSSLLQDGVQMQAKPFAVGLRAEHPQPLINRAQFGAHAQHSRLGAADYRLSFQFSDHGRKRGVYSFCMCPGGFIVPTPTEPGHMVVNGMSNANRSAPYANSGLVVQVHPQDLEEQGFARHPLMGIAFQRQLERATFLAADSPYGAPVMRISDFLTGRSSGSIAKSHFRPATQVTDLWSVLPHWLLHPIAAGLRDFARKIKGYDSQEGNLFAVESRSSSPLRIERNAAMQSVNTRGLYPVGEGAGYAGGIVSAAVDGLKSVEALILECG